MPLGDVPLFWKLGVPSDHPGVRQLQERAAHLLPVPRLHVTLLYVGGKFPREAAAANDMRMEKYLDLQQELEQLAATGEPIDFSIVGLRENRDMLVGEVRLPDGVPCANQHPHLTLSLRPGVAPKLANELMRKSSAKNTSTSTFGENETIKLRGVVSLETTAMNLSGRAVPASKAAPPCRAAPPCADGSVEFSNSTFTVHTNPRPSMSTEPRGYITLHCSKANEVAKKIVQAAEFAKLPVRCSLQKPGKPGHIYLRWPASGGYLTATDIGGFMEKVMRDLAVN